MAAPVPRFAFVDFMYAIVIGAAFPLIAPLEQSLRFVGLLFLLVVILEDFFLYHTQVATVTVEEAKTFRALLAEIGVLLAWYLSAIAFPASVRAFLLAFAAFYLLKWLAGLAHFSSLRQARSWRFYRTYSFFLPVLVSVILLYWHDEVSAFPVLWIIAALASVIQMAIWWLITKRMSNQPRVAV